MKTAILATALAAILSIAAGPALAEADLKKGAKVFRKCKACHQVGDGAENKVGPILNGVVGRGIAEVEGFKYSKAFAEKKTEGLIWDEAALDEYLTKPRKFIKGTKMSFAGLKKEKDRVNIIAYLATFP